MKNKIIAIIPARGGSKRIPKKNIKLFLGKPLIAYSIEIAFKSKLFDKIVVTTDDEKIANISKQYGATIINRPKELADDFVSSSEAVNHAIKYLLNQGEEFDFMCTIYATAPLLQEIYLKEGLEKLKQNPDTHMAFSVTSMPFPIQRTFKITKTNRCEMFTPEHFNTRSQDLEEAYQDAGQFYWENLKNQPTDIAFGKSSIPIILPRELVQDIDTLEDWNRAEKLYKIYYPNKFDTWNKLKQRLNKEQEPIVFYQGNIYFMSIGKNIGYEVYGKGELFLRPVLVYKKLSKYTFLGIPLTSQKKTGSYFFTFSYKKDKISTAMLHQMKVFDIRRSKYLSGKINKNTYQNLEKKVQDFLNITFLQKQEGMPTRAKSDLIIAQEKINVNKNK